MESGQVEVGPGGVPKDAKTSEYYRVKDIPNRFDHPDWFQGYKSKEQHPMYRTTNREYGAREPSVHTMPTVFHAKSQQFSGDLGKCGMYRNHSLNCASDKSFVPDH
ncbi:hypothetical protein LSH36_52g06054 [Paralvinella palmiformis]|uniref:Uncharacterized protein n=1 Tax=Paralvinella palmiformis TaxID=53620 RepID=A0AAD9NCJ4_9ANNE|nr:hypothetical protein LSH36_52g06054 [Paralvinella palmiformis]